MMMNNLQNTNSSICKISIVIPVFNTEKFLPTCLDSLLNQDLTQDEYEIICVDDGSTDSCSSILKKYALDNPCIKVITQKNKGQSAARNVGLYSAVGKYVWFVDSDDMIDNNSLGFITDIMDENSIDELTVGLDFVPENTTEIPENNGFEYKPEKKIDLRATCSGTKVFRRSVIIENGINWRSDLKLSDDVLFIYQFELFSKKNVYVKSPMYHYRTVANSTSHKKCLAVINKHMYSVKILSGIYVDIRNAPPYEMSKKQKKELNYRISLCVQTVLYDSAIKGDKKEQAEFIKEFKEKGLYPYKPIWINLKPKISLKRSVYDFMMFFFFNESLYKFIGGILRKICIKKNGNIE